MLCSSLREQSNLSYKASPAVDKEDDRDRNIRGAMAAIVIMLIFLWYLFS